jgi:hypothetical protein
MIYVFGTRSYGYVDRVPGLGHVITQFGHFNYVPLFPTKSFFVLEGSENGDDFRGVQLPMSGKSVLAGYIRVWGGLVALIFLALAGHAIGMKLTGNDEPQSMLIAAGLMILAFAGSFLPGIWWMICNGIVHAVTIGGLLYMLGKPGTSLGSLPMFTMVANVALGLYGLTRFWDFAGRDRGVQLAAALGIDRISAEEMLANMQGK